MEQYRIIEQDGQKYLYPLWAAKPSNALNDEDEEDDLVGAVMKARMTTEKPYIGVKSTGIIVLETELRAVKSVKYPNGTIEPGYKDSAEQQYPPSCEFIMAYTDRLNIPPNPKLELIGTEIEVKDHSIVTTHTYGAIGRPSIQEEKQIGYSHLMKRCLAAEKLIGMSPSDPKTYPEYEKLYNEWEQIKKSQP